MTLTSPLCLLRDFVSLIMFFVPSKFYCIIMQYLFIILKYMYADCLCIQPTLYCVSLAWLEHTSGVKKNKNSVYFLLIFLGNLCFENTKCICLDMKGAKYDDSFYNSILSFYIILIAYVTNLSTQQQTCPTYNSNFNHNLLLIICTT